MEVIAHRGASAYAPENSFAAFDLALAQGADALELDVRSTSDGHLVVLHDSRLLRTARDPRAITAVRSDDLMSIDAAARPPTLDAVLDRYGSATRWLVELAAVVALDAAGPQAVPQRNTPAMPPAVGAAAGRSHCRMAAGLPAASATACASLDGASSLFCGPPPASTSLRMTRCRRTGEHPP